MEYKTATLVLRLTPQQKKQVQAYAILNGCTPSAAARVLLLDGLKYQALPIESRRPYSEKQSPKV